MNLENYKNFICYFLNYSKYSLFFFTVWIALLIFFIFLFLIILRQCKIDKNCLLSISYQYYYYLVFFLSLSFRLFFLKFSFIVIISNCWLFETLFLSEFALLIFRKKIIFIFNIFQTDLKL